VVTNATCGREERRREKEEEICNVVFYCVRGQFCGGSTKLNRQVDKAIHAI
jgi:hypothetical protein